MTSSTELATRIDDISLRIADYDDADELRRDLANFHAASNLISAAIDDFVTDADESDILFIDAHSIAISHKIALHLLDCLALDDSI